ncbi:MAG: di-trans,poly-cis-decaprenylcistransferase, partial [Clostridia bacterium]|nr:di-trans,poly-cis-decaprenylcistransferase [Clostridia bacterium]
MSVYAFSTENWNRPKDEVDGLMDIFKKGFTDDGLKANEYNIKVRFSGIKSNLAEDLQKVWEQTEEDTKNNTGMVLNICFNYGGRPEIVHAVNELIASGVKSVTAEDISNHLFTAGMPDPDLIVRTSGELRTSNYMPWQSVYTEWYFPKTLWPDFKYKDLVKALNAYAKRERRHGAIKG